MAQGNGSNGSGHQALESYLEAMAKERELREVTEAAIKAHDASRLALREAGSELREVLGEGRSVLTIMGRSHLLTITKHDVYLERVPYFIVDGPMPYVELEVA